LIYEWITHDESVSLLAFVLLLHKVHGLSLLFLLLLLLLLGVVGVLALPLGCGGVVGDLLGGVVFLKSVQVVQHRIDSGDHILGIVSVLWLICVGCSIPLLLATLHATSTTRDILCIFFSSQPLQRLIQILKLFILFLS